ncbi:cytochrome P450 [Actinomadura rupiterrae]|uniref:cytochrome P450 n=1 Tax=Actinomadura rupiterrae TaxID=559627 RepID=UPI0020A273CB|nr:cytochrome P450 [Actinomadura rupiterrae]MCP2342536.1 unspecific monooxygenase [Actinomadura rupiterrae]
MSQRSKEAIPGPRGGILARHLTAYEADPVGFLEDCRRRYGDVFRFDTDVVVVTDPDLVTEVLARTNRDSVPNANPLHGGRFPTPEQTRRWMDARQLAAPIFRSASLPSRLPVVQAALASDLDALDGTWFDPSDACWAICVRALLPLYLPSESPALVDAVLASFDAARGAAEAAVRVPSWMPSRLRRRVRNADQHVRDTITPMLGCPHADASATMLGHIQAQPETVPSDIAMGAMGFTLLGAIGTMGAAWCWILYYLAAHPEAADRIREEATTATGITKDPARALPYTWAFAQEVLRLRPPAWLLGRDAITDVNLGDAEVPAGTAIMFSPYLLHHDERWWTTDPHKFSPERWLDTARPHTPGAYLPFASGPRGCLGTHLGLAILALTAVHITTQKRLDVPNLETITTYFGPSTLTPATMKARLTPK